MTRFLLAAFLALSVHAQQGAGGLDHFLGLNDTDSPATLQLYEAQDALNVESNLDGTALKKRGGFTREASLTVTTSAVSGTITGTCDNGDLMTIVCNDRQCSKSVNGASFSVFLSTAGSATSLPTRWSLVTVDGDFYGANDKRDAVFKYDCTTLTYPTGPPAGSLLALTEDRLIVADTSANPNRVNYSKSGDFVTFTTGSNAVDPWTDDIGAPGDKVTALKYDRGRLYIFKRTSITTCQLGDQYTTRCFPVSSNIGTQDPEAIVSAPDGLYFRAQDRSYWRLSESGLEPLSQRISNYVKNQLTGASRSNTQTSQSDWDAGVQSPTGTWNTATRAGSIFSSSVTLQDQTTAQMALGSFAGCGLSTSGYVSFIGLTSTYTVQYFGDVAATSDGWTLATNGTPPTDSASGGIFQSALVSINDDARYSKAIPAATTASKFLVFRTKRDASNDGYSVLGTASNTNVSATVGSEVVIRSGNTKFYAGTTVIYTDTSIAETTYSTFTLIVTTAPSAVYWWRNGVFIASAASANAYGNSLYARFGVSTESSDSTAKIYLDFMHVSSDVPQGTSNIVFTSTFTSKIFDTGYSTPTFGTLSVSSVTASGSVSAYSMRFSSMSNDTAWGSYVSVAPGQAPAGTVKRYMQYQASFTVNQSLIESPGLLGVSIVVATTGTYRTQCIQPAAAITGWGILSCAESNVGVASIVYYATSASTCAGLPSSLPNTWQTSPSNNATLTISTQAALYIGWRSLLGAATDQAQVDACTIYWNEGTPAQPVWGVYDSIRNSIYWTGTTTASTTSDRILKYDLNLNQFYPFGLSATALGIVNNSLYFGSSGGGYWNKFGASGINSDNGSDINAYWKSKDFYGVSPFQETTWQALSLVARNQTTGSMTATHGLSNGISGSHTVSLSTTSTTTYIRDNYRLPLTSPANFINVQLGNNSAVPFEVLGLKLDYASMPWKVQNP